MTLTIICPESEKHKPALNKALTYVGINDYQILDPAHDEVGREFTNVLFIGHLEPDRFAKLNQMSQKAWMLAAPNPNALQEIKKAWIFSLQKIRDYVLDTRDKDLFKKNDVPDIMQLKEYLNSKIGQVIQLTLPDRRKLGIYPDNQRLLGEYDVEYHASTVFNIAKLFKLFDASEIIIKEL